METKINNTTSYKNNENPINKNLTEFNYLKNEINTNPNLLSELNCSSSRERLRYMSEQNSFLKKKIEIYYQIQISIYTIQVIIVVLI